MTGRQESMQSRYGKFHSKEKKKTSSSARNNYQTAFYGSKTSAACWQGLGKS